MKTKSFFALAAWLVGLCGAPLSSCSGRGSGDVDPVRDTTAVAADTVAAAVGTGNTFAILQTKTHGMHDIAIDNEHVLKWNGKEYVQMN